MVSQAIAKVIHRSHSKEFATKRNQHVLVFIFIFEEGH